MLFLYRRKEVYDLFILYWLLGVLVGASICVLFYIFILKRFTIGTLLINTTDPEADICRLVIDENLDSLLKKKIVILKIDSQK